MAIIFIGSCVIEHPDFEYLTYSKVLEVNLKFVWRTGFVDTPNQQINNNNLRYSAYRSLFEWLW